MFPPVQRVKDQIWYLATVAEHPDIIALNEVNRYRQDEWTDKLEEMGYSQLEHTLDWAEELGESEVPPHQDFSHTNGNLIAVHESSPLKNLTRGRPSIREGPWDGAVLKDWSANFPEKILNVTVENNRLEIDMWNTRAIPGGLWGEEKIKIMENVFNRIKKSEMPIPDREPRLR